MGQCLSIKSYNQNPVNYNCPICKLTEETPNITGRFFLINDTQCQCNGCNTIFPKSQFYK